MDDLRPNTYSIDFAEVFLGVDLAKEFQNLTKEALYEKILDLQRQLAQAYALAGKTSLLKDYQITKEALYQKSLKTGIDLSSWEKDSGGLRVNLSGVSFRCFNKDLADKPFGGLVYKSLPLYQYQVTLGACNYKFTNRTRCREDFPQVLLVCQALSEFFSGRPLGDRVQEALGRFLNNPSEVQRSLVRFFRTPGELAECGHPHSNTHRREFRDGCTGTHFFARAIHSGKIKQASVFLNVLEDLVRWLGDYTMDDSYGGFCSPGFRSDFFSAFTPSTAFFQANFLQNRAEPLVHVLKRVDRALFRFLEETHVLRLDNGLYHPMEGSFENLFGDREARMTLQNTLASAKNSLEAGILEELMQTLLSAEGEAEAPVHPLPVVALAVWAALDRLLYILFSDTAIQSTQDDYITSLTLPVALIYAHQAIYAAKLLFTQGQQIHTRYSARLPFFNILLEDIWEIAFFQPAHWGKSLFDLCQHRNDLLACGLPPIGQPPYPGDLGKVSRDMLYEYFLAEQNHTQLEYMPQENTQATDLFCLT